MNRQRSTKALTDELGLKAVQLYRAGKHQLEIADALSQIAGKPITQPMVSFYIKRIRLSWRSSAIRNFDEHVAQQLDRLDYIEGEALDAWEKSKGKHKVTTTTRKTGEDGEQVSTREETSEGDPRYLAIANDCGRQRAEILGLNAAKKIDVTLEAVPEILSRRLQRIDGNTSN